MYNETHLLRLSITIQWIFLGNQVVMLSHLLNDLALTCCQTEVVLRPIT
jgi:hypothetical protein